MRSMRTRTKWTISMVTRTDDNLRLSRVFRSSCWLSFSTKPGSQTGTGTFEPGRIFAFVRRGVEHANRSALHAMIRASFVSRVGVMGLPFALVQLNKTDKKHNCISCRPGCSPERAITFIAENPGIVTRASYESMELRNREPAPEAASRLRNNFNFDARQPYHH